MAGLWNASPGNYGSFDASSIIGGSTSAGYYQQPMNLPYTQGRSLLATIPEFQLNPFAMEKAFVTKLSEGRANLLRVLSEVLMKKGGMPVKNVAGMLPVEITPNSRIYISAGAYTGTNSETTFKIRGNVTPIATAHQNGNINQKGDIARLDVGQFITLMFSWVTPSRGSAPAYSPNPGHHADTKTATVPEICKITSINYDTSEITVSRNWAGSARTSTPTAPGTLTIVADSGTGVPSTSLGGTGTILQKHAFLIPMAKSLQEDEIEGKGFHTSMTWRNYSLQRHGRMFGDGTLSRVIAQNMGIEPQGTQQRRNAIEQYLADWDYTLLFGGKSTTFETELGYWSGTTDGILTDIPASHYIALKGPKWSDITGSSANMMSFSPEVFNYVMSGKSLIGSQEKWLLVGEGFHLALTTMFNRITTAVSQIVSEWKVVGTRFMTSNGLTINIIPSDTMSLNGMRNFGILIDPQYFQPLYLQGYPVMDIMEMVSNNPLKSEGFVHGIKGAVNLNPDAHWVFQLIPELNEDGVTNSFYSSVSLTGTVLG